MSRYCYFFRRAWKKSPGNRYNNCIVFSKGAFPKYGKDCWVYNESDDEDDIGVFRLGDGKVGSVGESEEFPKIDWSIPSWVMGDSQSECEDEDDEMQHEIKMEYEDASSPNGPSSSHSSAESQAEEDEAMHSDTNVEDGALLPNGTSMGNTTQMVPRACTSSTTKSHHSNSPTAKFQGYDIRFDLAPTLQKIWHAHGNIIENSIFRSGDIVGRALESVATMVHVIEDNTTHSLSSSQADYLTSTLSDIRRMGFKVCWLTPFVEKAEKVHQCKAVLDSLKNVDQLIAQVKERRTKLNEEEKKLKETRAELTKKLIIYGEVYLDEPLGKCC